MPYRTKHLILYAALLLPALLRSQTEDLSRDLGFFNGQLVEYQRWLDRTGLGTTLRAREVQADTLLKVYLEFAYADSDSAQNAWEALRRSAARRGASRTLEELLFLRAVSCFDVDREHLSLRLYDTYDADRDFCFKRKIFAEQNQIRVDSIRGLCRKPKPSTIPIQVGDLAQLRKGQRGEPVKARVSRTAVFEKTKLFLQTKYGPKSCPGRKPALRFTVDAPNLDEQELVIHNLCDEIIQEGQPGLCEALRYFGHDCNWKKNEKIRINLRHKPVGNTGFLLEILVEGHYGSGFQETQGRRSYHDMETDFDAELTEYAKLLTKELNEYLLKNL